MSLEAQYLKDSGVVDFVAIEALVAGQVVQLPDGRAGVYTGLKSAAIGDVVGVSVAGIYKMAKTATMVLLNGQKVYWDKASSKIKYSSDFYVGVVVADAASADTTCNVALNVEACPVIAMGKGAWNQTETLGLGLEGLAGTEILAFDAVEEAATAALYSADLIDIDEGPIWEAEIAIFDIGDDAALDINFGLASATHADDFDSIGEYIAFHLDGNALSVLAQSTDGTTTVTATDTTKDAVDDTYALYQIDLRDKDNPKLYINGVRVLAATDFDMTAYTSTLLAILHVEKASNNTSAEVRVKSMHVRTAARG